MELQGHEKEIFGASSSEKILLILINKAVKCAESSRLEQNESARRSLIDQSRRIVTKLATILNTEHGGEQAFNLLRLYIFINRRLADSLEGDERALPDALRILRHLQETWIKAVELAAVDRLLHEQNNEGRSR